MILYTLVYILLLNISYKAILRGVLTLNLFKELTSLSIYKDLIVIVLITIKPYILILIKVYNSSLNIIRALLLIKAYL
jgi:hypothetical protein